MDTDVLILGGGLSGLAVADALAAQGVDYRLVEARHRLGGRIDTARVAEQSFDLGPAWFWPGQPRMAAMAARFGLRPFAQYADGALSFEDERGQVQRGRGFASMDGSFRLEGGMTALVDALHAHVPDERLQTEWVVADLSQEADGVTARSTDGRLIKAQHVVCTLPPRLVAGLGFDPVLPAEVLRFLGSVPTWMAGQAKAVMVYDTAFWREAGLSGDAMSRHGPLVEIHDASPSEGGPFALFGFVGVPARHRDQRQALEAAVLGQMGRLFGPQAATPKSVFLRDWAYDPFTATQADFDPPGTHPTYGLPKQLLNLMAGRLILAGTETAPEFGGYLEGALEAAERAVAVLGGRMETQSAS